MSDERARDLFLSLFMDEERAVPAIAAALRAAHDAALDEAAQRMLREADFPPNGHDSTEAETTAWHAGCNSCADIARSLASPAAAPAVRHDADDWKEEFALEPAAPSAAHKANCPATHFDPFREDLCTCNSAAPALDLLKECHAFLMALREWPPLATSALRHEVDAILVRFATPSPAQRAEARDLFAARLATQLVYARARLAELEAGLREAQAQLCAEHCEWALRGDHDDQCVRLSKVLAVKGGAGEGT